MFRKWLGGALAVSPDGTVQTVWRREYEVYTCTPGKPERLLGEGGQPWIAMSTTPKILWQRSGSVYCQGLAGPMGLGSNPAVAPPNGLTAAVWADDKGHVWCAPVN